MSFRSNASCCLAGTGGVLCTSRQCKVGWEPGMTSASSQAQDRNQTGVMADQEAVIRRLRVLAATLPLSIQPLTLQLCSAGN